MRASHCLGTPCTWQLYDICDLIFRETARVLFFLRKNRRQCSRRTGGSNAYGAVCHPVSLGDMHTMLLSVHACGAQADAGAGPACSPLGHQWARVATNVGLPSLPTLGLRLGGEPSSAPSTAPCVLRRDEQRGGSSGLCHTTWACLPDAPLRAEPLMGETRPSPTQVTF